MQKNTMDDDSKARLNALLSIVGQPPQVDDDKKVKLDDSQVRSNALLAIVDQDKN